MVILMQPLNFPTCNFRIRTLGDRQEIFDIVRKRFVALTPEEWVRQHVLHFMNAEKSVPLSLMAVEKSLKINTLKKRADLVVHERSGRALMLVECKAPGVKITQQVFDQAARYDMVFHVNFLLITNGLANYCCRFDYSGNTYAFLPEIPSYAEMIATI
jgi:hypothetical protein